MSFRFSPGTLDSLAGVFAEPKKRRSASGGGRAHPPEAGGTMLAFAVSSMLPAPTRPASGNRPSVQAKHAFGGSTSTETSGRAMRTMERTARRVPEVVVRITGRQHGGGHVLANFSYVSRLGHGEDKQVALYTSDGDVLRDGRDMQILAQDWQEWEEGGEARRSGSTSISMVLSMPAATDPDILREAALTFAREEFANRSWVAALHVDRDHPHVHLTIARRDHDGRRFHPDREDLFRFRQRFAQKLRDRGIEANATPVRARGIDPRHEHIAARKMREKGQVPQLDKSRAKRAQAFRDRGVADPVKRILAERHAIVLRTYAKSIVELSASPSLADQVRAQTVQKFIDTMPEPESNAERAARFVREQGADRANPLSQRSPGEAVNTTSAERLKAVKDRLAETTRQASALGPSATSRDLSVAEPDLSPAAQRFREALANAPDRLREIEREREARERQRQQDRDRGGPSR